MALTILGEAEGEPDEGKAAVAHVVKNRMRWKPAKWGTVADTVLAPYAFSCFNARTKPDVPVRRDFLLDTVSKGAANIPMGMWAACWRAAAAVLDGTSADVTEGATHYVVRRLWGCDDSGRKKPRWHSQQCIDSGVTRETVRIGGHVFARTP